MTAGECPRHGGVWRTRDCAECRAARADVLASVQSCTLHAADQRGCQVPPSILRPPRPWNDPAVGLLRLRRSHV